MRQTFTVNFYCRPSKADKKGFSPIELSLILNGKRVYITLPRKERTEDFERLTEQKRENELKVFLESYRKRINEVITELNERQITVTVDNIKLFLNGAKDYRLTDLFREFNDYSLKSKKIAYRTHKKYLFIQSQLLDYFGDKILTDITKINANQYFNYLQKRDYKPNTLYEHLGKINAMFRYATDDDKLKNNPFAHIKLPKGEKKWSFLTEEEIKRLITTPLEDKYVDRARKLFLFLCATGLSYCDMANLTKEDIKEENGLYYIQKNRIKSNIEYTSVILPFGIDILKSYNFELPKMTNQRINLFLKVVQVYCKIEQNLFCHLGRKTYLTFLLNNGVRLETVAKCGGHASIKTTQSVYAKIRKETVLNETKDIVKSFKI